MLPLAYSNSIPLSITEYPINDKCFFRRSGRRVNEDAKGVKLQVEFEPSLRGVELVYG